MTSNPISPPYTSCQFHIFWHNSHALDMNSTQIAILKEAYQIGLSGLCKASSMLPCILIQHLFFCSTSCTTWKDDILGISSSMYHWNLHISLSALVPGQKQCFCLVVVSPDDACGCLTPFCGTFGGLFPSQTTLFFVIYFVWAIFCD